MQCFENFGGYMLQMAPLVARLSQKKAFETGYLIMMVLLST